MERRKRIALITAVPEDLHGNNIIEGIRIQCEKYDYDFYIFSAMTHLENHMQDYVTGESNIFNLANYEELDGVIIDTVNVFYGQSGSILRKLRESLSAYPKLAVASLELPLEGIPLIPDQNEEVLRERRDGCSWSLHLERRGDGKQLGNVQPVGYHKRMASPAFLSPLEVLG